MALIVEDGTAKTDAESYISVADASAYLSNRGYSGFTGLASDTDREEALRKATDYMVQVYRLRWDGVRKTSTQALDWPRSFVKRPDFEYSGLNGYTVIGGDYYYPSDEVPAEVANACALLAEKSVAGDLSPDIERLTKREKVDVLEVEYADNAPAYTQYRAIDNMLAVFFGQGTFGTFRKVIRA